jgi:hypothetical protein|tara:strand:- start:4222 stop:4527 length:306 start_codon:yes stop_codon:yes gene_type:complete
MARFVGIPAIPLQNMSDWEAQVFHSIKENVELLCGTRGESDEASKAITKGNISVSSMGQQDMRVVSGIVALADLVDTVQVLANDLAEQRTTLNTLIEQLKA